MCSSIYSVTDFAAPSYQVLKISRRRVRTLAPKLQRWRTKPRRRRISQITQNRIRYFKFTQREILHSIRQGKFYLYYLRNRSPGLRGTRLREKNLAATFFYSKLGIENRS